MSDEPYDRPTADRTNGEIGDLADSNDALRERITELETAVESLTIERAELLAERDEARQRAAQWAEAAADADAEQARRASERDPR